MSFIWMIAAGLIASTMAKLLLPKQSAGGLFVLGFGGAFIASMLEYSERIPIGFFGPLTGAAILLAIYAATIRGHAAEETSHDDLRKAA